MKRLRNGFTLVEILVVMTILLMLAGLALAVFNAGKSSDKMRSGARVAQSAFLGAKDRALHAKDFRGVRLTRDLTNTNLLNGFVYLQPLPLQSAGNTAGNNPNDFAIYRPVSDATQIVISGTEGQAFFNQDSAGIWPPMSLQIRIPAGTGQWFQLARQNMANPLPPFWIAADPATPGNYLMNLQTGYPGGDPGNPTIGAGDPRASCDVKLGNELLPFHQPITLPPGCVIDLAYCNSSVQVLAGYNPVTPPNPLPNIDVMFSPRGNLTGPISALGMFCFTLRDIRDATRQIDPTDKTVQGDCLILAVIPQTGLVQTFDADLTSTIIAGKADNLFSFAQRGQSAGR